jgi:hypothetical protein
MTWGVDAHIIESFDQAGVPKEKITTVKGTYSFISPDKSPAHVIELFRRYYGPTMNAFEAAEPATFLPVMTLARLVATARSLKNRRTRIRPALRPRGIIG